MVAAVPPNGVYVPSPTFFLPSSGVPDSQPDVDIATQAKHTVFLAESGVRGVVLLGSTGEAIHLTQNERFDLVAGVRKGLDDAGFSQYPIMAGVLTNGIDETLEWLADYERAGAQWGLVLAPGYFGKAASQDNIKAWYVSVANKSPIPILIYNYPGVTNQVMLEPETYVELAQHPNIVGCKMSGNPRSPISLLKQYILTGRFFRSHGDVSVHVQVTTDPRIDHANFRLYSGFAQQLGPIVLFGAAGVIDGLSAFYPRTVVRLQQLAEERPMEQATLDEIQKLQYAVSRAQNFIIQTGIIGIREGILRVTGMGSVEGGRLPLSGRLAKAVWEELETKYLVDVRDREALL